MASLKNVHPCTFFSFEFSWWKTRYCLEPLTSCQYSDVTVICNVPVANYLASFTKIKFLWNVVSDLSARRPWRYWAKTRLQCAQGWAWDRSETSFGTKLVLNRCTWTDIGTDVRLLTMYLYHLFAKALAMQNRRPPWRIGTGFIYHSCSTFQFLIVRIASSNPAPMSTTFFPSALYCAA